MRPVGVHFDHDVVASLGRPGEPGEVGAAEAVLLAAMKDVDARIARRQRVGDGPGAVGRVVVDDQDIDGGNGREQVCDHAFDAGGLVVGGRDDENPAPGVIRPLGCRR